MKDAAVNKKPAPAGLLNIVKTYSFVLVFLVIYIVYASVSGGFALGAAMNVFRHSAVIGVIAIGMGIVCLTGDIDLSFPWARCSRLWPDSRSWCSIRPIPFR